MCTSVKIEAIISKRCKKKVGKFAYDFIGVSIAGNRNGWEVKIKKEA